MTSSKIALSTASVLLIALALTGCGAAAAPTTSIQPDGGPYANVDELKAAYIEAGGECEDGNWRSLGYEGGTIECDGDTLIDVFTNPDDMDKFRDDMVEADSMQQVEITTNWLQGENWLVRSTEEDMATVQETLGGELKSFTTRPNF